MKNALAHRQRLMDLYEDEQWRDMVDACDMKVISLLPERSRATLVGDVCRAWTALGEPNQAVACAHESLGPGGVEGAGRMQTSLLSALASALEALGSPATKQVEQRLKAIQTTKTRSPARGSSVVRGGAVAVVTRPPTSQAAVTHAERVRWTLADAGIHKLVAALQESPTDADVQAAVRARIEDGSLNLYADEFPLLTRLEKLLGEETLAFAPTGPLGRRLKAFWTGVPDTERDAWGALLLHCANVKREPTTAWLNALRSRLSALPSASTTIEAWFSGLVLSDNHFGQAGFDPRNEALATGLVAAVCNAGSPETERFLGDLAEICWRKVSGVGAPSKRVGTFAIRSLTRCATPKAVTQLTRLKRAVQNDTARRQIEASLTELARASGVAPAELEERNLPTFGLDEDGTKRVSVLDWTAEISVYRRARLHFIDADGKRLQGVPKAVRERAPDALRALRAERKHVAGVLTSQASRIERFWIEDRVLPAGTLAESYLGHPLIGDIARRLFWTVDGRTAFFQQGALRDLAGDPVPLTTGCVRLWHPLTAPEGEQLVLRDLGESIGLCQPFEQLYRSTYKMPIDPNRLEGRLLLQHAFLEHCRIHGWTAQRLGTWSGGDIPAFYVPSTGADLELNVTSLVHDTDVAGARFLRTGSISLQLHGEPLQASADPVLVSEMVRVADRAVTACGAGGSAPIDGFFDGMVWAEEAYRALTGVEAARIDVLDRLLPRMSLKGVATLDPPFLRIGTTEIHLGTLAVRVEGLAATLRVSTEAKDAAAKALLPTEHDPDLAQILALALSVVVEDAP